MAYEPTIWKKGDIISSTKLNKLENGVANNGILVVNITGTSGLQVLDKTWQEIHDATLAIVKDVDQGGGGVYNRFVYQTNVNGSSYEVCCICGTSYSKFTTGSPTGYPEQQPK